ncbi:PqiC family protein [Stutzerimonas nitrititolerans]|uniref:PqiC family protein n=1 Tax=Stutzerimonas nitrititolerans TaxID=2482751 RepID=UPI00289F5086|nr:PqiC family protein [Stutzerimonas nitrititolerans]
MPLPRSILVVTALLLLVACRGDPIQFYTLSPTQTEGVVQASDIEVQIESISVPPQVDRQQIVIRSSDSSLAIQESHWWGASLVDEFRGALVQQLPNDSAGRKLSLRLDVQRLDSIPGQYAFIDAKWRLRNLEAGNKAVVHCRSALKTAAGMNINDIVIAHQKNLQRLAAEISQAAREGRCS